jgi:prefoldin subunit 5
MTALRKRVTEIVENQENNMEKFRKELEKMIPHLEAKVNEVDETLQTSNVARKTADID